MVIDNGMIASQQEQERFLRIAESRSKEVVATWAAFRGIELALSVLPSEGAAGAVLLVPHNQQMQLFRHLIRLSKQQQKKGNMLMSLSIWIFRAKVSHHSAQTEPL